MRMFSEEVKHTFSNSPLNILQVADFSEIFFGVYEVEINKRKYPVEEVSKYNGNPVVSIPIVVEGVEQDYPFVLLRGEEEIFFNESNTEIPESDVEIVEEEVADNEQILIDIQNLKKEAIRQAQEELSKNTAILKEQAKREKAKKEKALKNYLESARENLVEEFTNISQKIKNELISENDGRFSEIKDTIDNKIQDLADSLNESLKKDFNNSSKLIDKSIKQLVKDLYENNINPRVDKELNNIAVEIVEKVSEIDKNLNSKLDKKADISLIEGVEKELDSIRDSNIELNNSLNKGIQKALSRVGNVDKKIIDVSEKFERRVEKTEKDITSYFDEKINLLKEETLDITDEARLYFQNLIQESKNGLLSEIRKIKNEKPVEYILETKNGKSEVKDWDSIEKDWNKKIHDKIENVRTDLRKYVAVYASGGGTNAKQYANGGVINGDLVITGSLSAGSFSGNSSVIPFYDKKLFKYNLEVGENNVITFPIQTEYNLIQSSFTLVFSTLTSKNTLKLDCVVNNGSVLDTGYAAMNSGSDLYSNITSILSSGYLVVTVNANNICQLTIVGEAIYEPGLDYEGTVMISENDSILVSENSDIFVFEN